MSKPIEVLSAVHGIAPRSDELLKLGADLERGRVSQEDYEFEIDNETDKWLRLQRQSLIDIREDGKLWWPDHLRNIVKGSHGFAPDVDQAPVTRWFEDNRFYRQPTIIDRLQFDSAAFQANSPEIGLLGPNVSLLAPRSFAARCKNEYLELPADRNVLQLYSQLLFYFEQVGMERVTFEDYSDGDICANGKSHDLADIETIAKWCPNINFAIINPQNKETAIPWRLAGNLGVQIPPKDLVEISREPEYRRPDFTGGEIWHNVIDASTTLDDKANVATIPVEALRLFEPARVVLTHTVDLECLPLKYAQDKVKRLGELASELRAELAK